MTDFSLICSAHNATSRGLREMLDSLAAQTLQSYEVVLIVGNGRARERQMVEGLLPNYPAARMVLRPNQETLAASATQLLGSLEGAWVGFIGHRDQLLPETLAAALHAVAEHPAAKVVFTDEECRDALNRVTQRFDKLGFNPMRLRSQEYLRDLALIERAWLQTLKGFNPVTSEWPAHDIYLRTFEALGESGFVHIPERLYQRFRQYRDRPADLRRRAHVPGFDTKAVKLHLERQRIQADVKDHYKGTLDIRYRLPSNPWVQVFIVLDGDSEAGLRQIRSIMNFRAYQATHHTVVCTHPDPMVHAELQAGCKPFGLTVAHVPGNLPRWLNQEIPRSQASYIALLRGENMGTAWLGQLLSHALLDNVGVVGGKCITPLRVTQPGVLNYRYEGWDWNTRGKFNLLQVTHNVSTVSPNNMLFSVSNFLRCNGFDFQLPTLFGMEFCLRMRELGAQVLSVANAAVMTQERPAEDSETALFKGRWSSWADPYQQILSW